MSARFTSLSALLLLPLSAEAAELPKQGQDSYTTTYVEISSSSMKAGDRTVLNYEVAGITRNDSGGPMFNDLSARCLGAEETINAESSDRGTCVETDKDGDQIFTTYGSKGGTGTHVFIGGSGKYTGLSGSASYTSKPISSPYGRWMVVVSHKADWKLP